MRAPLSIVIPTLNDAARLSGLLPSLYQGVQAELIREVIVTDGGSTDDIAVLADQIGAELVTGAPGRGGQLARGAAVAQGGWLLFLHADARLDGDWTEAVIAHMQDHGGKAGWFRLAFDGAGRAGRLVAAWANLRARLFGMPFGDQGLLIPRRLYDEVGGFADIPLMEDMDLSRRLRGHLRPLDASVRTDASRYRQSGWAAQGASNLWRQLRFLCGADPRRLAPGYDRSRIADRHR